MSPENSSLMDGGEERPSTMMDVLVLTFWVVFAVLYGWTLNAVYLVPLLSGLVYVVSRTLQDTARRSAQRVHPDEERRAKELAFQIVFQIVSGIMAFLALAHAVSSFLSYGWTWEVPASLGCCLYFLWVMCSRVKCWDCRTGDAP